MRPRQMSTPKNQLSFDGCMWAIPSTIKVHRSYSQDRTSTSEIFQVSDIESAVFQALKKELSLLDSLYGDMQKEELALKEAHKKANRRKTLMEQELKNLKGEKMRMYEEYAAGTLPLSTSKSSTEICRTLARSIKVGKLGVLVPLSR